MPSDSEDQHSDRMEERPRRDASQTEGHINDPPRVSRLRSTIQIADERTEIRMDDVGATDHLRSRAPKVDYQSVILEMEAKLAILRSEHERLKGKRKQGETSRCYSPHHRHHQPVMSEKRRSPTPPPIGTQRGKSRTDRLAYRFGSRNDRTRPEDDDAMSYQSESQPQENPKKNHLYDDRPSHCAELGERLKRVKSLSTSPFSEWIRDADPPSRFSSPTFALYDGKSDPITHVEAYTHKMAIWTHNEPLMCRMFPSSLGPTTARWFFKLKEGFIDSWDDLAEQFCARFIVNSKEAVRIDKLLTLKLKNSEHI